MFQFGVTGWEIVVMEIENGVVIGESKILGFKIILYFLKTIFLF